MSWNYRIMRHCGKWRGKPIIYFGLHEVYYDEKGNVDGWTKDSIVGFFESPVELRAAVEMMRLGCIDSGNDLPLGFLEYEPKTKKKGRMKA